MSANCRSRRRLLRGVPLGLIAVATIAPSASAGVRTAVGSLRAKAIAADAQARASSGGSVFLGGFTSQNEPVVIHVAKSWKTIPLMRIALDMQCASGTTVTVPDAAGRLQVGAHGRVRATYSFPSANGIQSGTDSLTGTLNRHRETFSGVWHLQLTLSASNGQSDSCDSGPVTFTAAL